MKKNVFFLQLLICSVPALSYSQNTGKSLTAIEIKDSVGLQHNLMFDYARDNVTNIFSSRYEYRNVRFLKIGSEISGFFLHRENPLDEFYGVSLAIYPRHSYSSDKMLPGLGDSSYLNQIYLNNTMEYKTSDGFIYIAPGISVFSKNRKFSLDIYHKLSTPIIIDGIQPIIPYKVSLHF